MTINHSSRRVIDEFIERYSREIDHHERLARTCKEYLERVSQQLGVRAIFTHRVKSPGRLYDKLLQRSERRREKKQPQYRTHEDIRRDIVDLAGVRVALYFPGDRIRFDKFIAEQVFPLESKSFPASDVDGVRPGSPLFAGYMATHHRVYWPSLLDEKSRADNNERHHRREIVEIQVASVLMHA